MQGLSGDRFLKWFAGDLKNRRKQQAFILKDQIPETDLDIAVGPDKPAPEEDCANKLTENNDLPNK